jgi:hypothetical protein
MPLLWVAAVFVVVTVVTGANTLFLAAAVLLVVALVLYLRVGTVRGEPLEIRPPVTGRWIAMNTPAQRVPSHGLHAYGQTYAVDIVYEPLTTGRPSFGWWPLVRRSAEYPGFGRPVLAPVDGVVVRVHDRERDHWSRSSWLAVAYVLVEGAFREALGPSRILGNHVVIAVGDGVYVVLAHLRRRSVQVAVGQEVAAGERIASCGNSGNSTEPHVHVQVMDHPSVLFAAGLPMCFDGFVVDGVTQGGMPRNGVAFEVPEKPDVDLDADAR